MRNLLYVIPEFEGKVLLKPDQNQILRYGSNDSIIIERLISESPKGKTEPYNLAIEKLIVDLFANKTNVDLKVVV